MNSPAGPLYSQRYHAVLERQLARRSEYGFQFDTIAMLDSEIERILAAELMDLFCPRNELDAFIWPPWNDPDRSITIEEAKIRAATWFRDSDAWQAYGPRDRAIIFPQVRIGRYRVDFLIFATDPPDRNAALVVECDGHDFHERTKDQAARDRQRDRTLTSIGIPFMRFTGSEIYRDSFGCMRELENQLWRQMHGKDCPLRDFDPPAEEQP